MFLINFEEASRLKDLFKDDFDIERIIRSLQIFSHKRITPADTLIIFDEILSVLSALDMRTLIEGDRVFAEFKGAFTKQFVM